MINILKYKKPKKKMDIKHKLHLFTDKNLIEEL